MLHDLLWQLNTDITQRCLEHPFVRELADGTLDRDVFRRYVAKMRSSYARFCGRMHWQPPSAMT